MLIVEKFFLKKKKYANCGEISKRNEQVLWDWYSQLGSQ